MARVVVTTAEGEHTFEHATYEFVGDTEHDVVVTDGEGVVSRFPYGTFSQVCEVNGG